MAQDHLAQFGMSDGFVKRHLDQGMAGAVLVGVDVDADDRPQGLLERKPVVVAGHGQHRVAMGLDDGGEERRLVGEEAVERPFGDTGARRDLAHRGATEAAFEEEAAPRLDDQGAPVVVRRHFRPAAPPRPRRLLGRIEPLLAHGAPPSPERRDRDRD